MTGNATLHMMNAVIYHSVIFKVHHETQTDACLLLVFLMKMLLYIFFKKSCESRQQSKAKNKTKTTTIKIQVKPFSRSSLGQSAVAMAITLDAAEKPLGGTEA